MRPDFFLSPNKPPYSKGRSPPDHIPVYAPDEKCMGAKNVFDGIHYCRGTQ